MVHQLLREFWLPLLVAVGWTALNAIDPPSGQWMWMRYVNIGAPTFFFMSWLTAQYFRIRKQQHVSTALESIEARVGRVTENLERQTEMLNYLNHSRLIQTFDECIDGLRDANEELADRSRDLKVSSTIDTKLFLMRRSNPFYQLERNLTILIRYGMHVATIGEHTGLEARYSRTGHHVEELAGHVGTFIGRLDHIGLDWRTRRSKALVQQICSRVSEFRTDLLKYSRYETDGYKGAQNLRIVLDSHVANLRRLSS